MISSSIVLVILPWGGTTYIFIRNTMIIVIIFKLSYLKIILLKFDK